MHKPDKKYTDFHQVRDEIQRETDRLTGTNKNISPVPIYLKIHSSKVVELTLVDLPGLTKVAVGDQPEDIEIQIKEMVMDFVSKESCLILAVTPANTDIANSDALQLAKKVDPQGDRTIGVLTKLDLMDQGTDASEILLNKTYPLKHGFVGVVNRSQKDIELKKDVQSALNSERLWFAGHPVYSGIKNMCGTLFLQEKLRKTLIHHIEKHLPTFKHHLQLKLSEVQKQLDIMESPFKALDSSFTGNVKLDPTDSATQQSLALNILRMFGSAIKTLIDGHDGDIKNDPFNTLGVLSSPSSPGSEQKSAPSGRNLAELSSSVRIKYIFQETFPSALLSLESRLLSSYYDEEIRTMIHNVRGLRAGLFTPDSVFELLIKRHIASLESPTLACVDMVHRELVKMIQNVLEGPNSPIKMFPNLKKWMLNNANWVLEQCRDPTIAEVKRLIEMELAYINTSHPDFLGRKGLAQWITEEKKERKKLRKSGITSGASFSGHKEGWLQKMGGSRKNWKKRWFVLKDGEVLFYESATDKNPKGSFSLSECCIRDLETSEIFPHSSENSIPEDATIGSIASEDKVKDGKLSFEIYTSSGEVLFRNHKKLVLQAESEGSKDEWIKVLSGTILHLEQLGNQQPKPQSPNSKSKPKLPPPVKPKPAALRPPTPPRAEPGTLASLPEKLYVSDWKSNSKESLTPELAGGDDSELSSSDDTTVTLVRILIHSYFQIIRKHVQDLVPKAIMLLMVSKVKQELPAVLMSKILRNVDENGRKLEIGKLLEESDGAREDRAAKMKMCKMLQEALAVINSDVTAQAI